MESMSMGYIVEAAKCHKRGRTFEDKLEATVRVLERKDAILRRAQAIQSELHLRDLRKHHEPLTDISAADATRIGARAGVLPRDMPPPSLPAQADGWMRPAFI
jgi:hypothetical protein